MQTQDIFLDQLIQFFDVLKPKHLFFYVAVFVGALFLAKRWIYVFVPIFIIQTLSLSVDVIFLSKIKRLK